MARKPKKPDKSRRLKKAAAEVEPLRLEYRDAYAVREWCIAHGDDERLRIALCGYEGEHIMPPSWECVAWKAPGGFASVSKDPNAMGNRNCRRERIWFSPHCLKVAKAVAA